MTEQNVFEAKIIIESLPIGGPDEAERRIYSDKGEMAQIINREGDSFRQIVYWTSTPPGPALTGGITITKRKRTGCM